MKKIIYLLCGLLISTTIIPFFDLSPWIVIDNKTKLDFICEFEAICYDFDNENSYLFLNNEDNLDVVCNNGQDKHDNEFMKFTFSFNCQAKHTTVFNPMFYEFDQLFNPKIISLAFTHQSLQLKAYCDPQEDEHRYFSIEYQPDNGICTQTQAISIYVKCLSNLKQSLRAIIMAALKATTWLPY